MDSSTTKRGAAPPRWSLPKPGQASLSLDVIQLDRHDATRLDRARAIVRDLGSVLVAYSGGVDSTLLLKLALDELGDRAAGVLASSPAYPESEQQEARVLAGILGARLVEVATDEVELDAYARNNP